MIPKIIHQIWVGPHSIPEKLEEYSQTWRDLNPEWRYKRWTDKNIPKLVNQKEYNQATTYAEKKDILELEILYEEGGLYVDMDYFCLKSINKPIERCDNLILNKESYNQQTEYREEPYKELYNNALLGSIPGHPFIKKLIDEIPSRAKAWKELPEITKIQAGCPPCWRAGPIYLTDMLEKENINYFTHEPRVWNRAYAQHPYHQSWLKPEGRVNGIRRGTSKWQGKIETMDYIKKNIPKDNKILDVGFGAGVYGKLLKNSGYKHVDGIDIYGDGVKETGLDKVYNNIYIEDILSFSFDFYDLIIFGDVLEHLELEDAKKLLQRFIHENKCDNLIVSIPYKLPVAPFPENRYEEHLQPDVTAEYIKQHYPYLKLIYDEEYEFITGNIAVYVWKREKKIIGG